MKGWQDGWNRLVEFSQHAPINHAFRGMLGAFCWDSRPLAACLKVKPTLSEVQARLRVGGWQQVELRAVLSVCAQDPRRYKILPPRDGHAPCVLLRDLPTGTFNDADVDKHSFSPEHSKDAEVKGGPRPPIAPPPERLNSQGLAPVLEGKLSTMVECVHGLYKDRIEPTLPEIQARLRGAGWSFVEAQQAVLIYASQPQLFKVVKPSFGKPLTILLRETPTWFLGWSEEVDSARSLPSADVQMGLKYFLACGLMPPLRDGISEAAATLKDCCCQNFHSLSLGEIRRLLDHFLEKGLLVYTGREISPSRKLLDEFGDGKFVPRAGSKPVRRIYSSI
eukprot:TRINITY_DN20343_c0_g1_i1.p1 TRINITY_DN20343_c0_g1~~TRINITY_DN20343_c0_g1_i1.p1  ORF type:complete len:335 (+),score=53.63 TRINITY_DN20343_c0_g1_i1:96-1100(+)